MLMAKIPKFLERSSLNLYKMDPSCKSDMMASILVRLNSLSNQESWANCPYFYSSVVSSKASSTGTECGA